MGKPKFIKEIEKLEGKERAKLGKYYIRVYGQLDNKPMVELESLEIVVKELHKLEEENKKLKGLLKEHITTYDVHFDELIEENKKLKAELEEADKAKMNSLNGMSDLSSFGLEQVKKLEEKNKKLKEDNRFLTKISKEYMEKENIIEVAEFTQLYKDDLEEENKKLNERIKELEQCNLNLQTWLDNKEKVNKQLRKDIKWYEKEEDRLREENGNLKEYQQRSQSADGEQIERLLGEKIKLEEENQKLKLHIEAKDKAYTALLKDYEEIKEDRDRMKEEIEQRLNAFRNR